MTGVQILDKPPVPIFAVESYADIWREVLPLAERHYAEVTAFPDLALNLMTDTYERLHAAGVLRMFTARIAGELVGYCSMALARSPHTGEQIAREDGIYVAPEHRGGTGAGVMLIRLSDERLAAEQVKVVHRTIKVAHDHGAVLARQGYAPIETTYARRLDT